MTRLVCVRQADTWTWPDHLGAKTEGECADCGSPIFYEAQNAAINPKVCAQCAARRPSVPGVLAILRRIWLPYAILLGAGIAVALLLVLADAIWRAL